MFSDEEIHYEYFKEIEDKLKCRYNKWYDELSGFKCFSDELEEMLNYYRKE